jgi:hypothetical protein
LATRKKPSGQEWQTFAEAWRAADHDGKIALTQKVGVTYDTAKHWITEGDTSLAQGCEGQGFEGVSGETDSLVGEILATVSRVHLDFVSFDLETTNLKADFSVVLSAAIKPYGLDTKVYRADNYSAWQQGQRHDDHEIIVDISRELARHAIVVTHYGCLTLGHRILTSDLNWQRVETLAVGDKLIGFEEEAPSAGHHRQLRESTVVSTGIDGREVWEITLSDGTVLEATPDHKWLLPIFFQSGWNGYGWKRTDELSIGDVFSRIFPVWNIASDFASGYLSGIIDGEGCLTQRSCERGQTIDLRIAQNEGVVLSRVLQILDKQEVPCTLCKEEKGDCQHVLITGGRETILELIGRVRPKRILQKLDVNKLGSIKQMKEKEAVTVTGLRRMGIRSVVVLGTSTGTYIAEGFLTHNSGFDLPYLRAKMTRYNLPPLPPMFGVDTYRIAKDSFLVSRRRLEALAEYFNLGEKHGIESNIWMRAGMDGDTKALDEVVAHNIVDVIILEKLASVSLPYMRSMRRL